MIFRGPPLKLEKKERENKQFESMRDFDSSHVFALPPMRLPLDARLASEQKGEINLIANVTLGTQHSSAVNPSIENSFNSGFVSRKSLLMH